MDEARDEKKINSEFACLQALGHDVHIRCKMTASFRATATLALRSPLRFASLTPICLPR